MKSTVKRMDGLRVKRLVRQSAPKSAVAYPDLTDLLEPVLEQPQQQEQYGTHLTQDVFESIEAAALVQETALTVSPSQAVRRQPKKRRIRQLKTVKRGIISSGFSWFLVFAILTSSAIGLFSVAAGGIAAKNDISAEAEQAEQALTSAATALASQQPEAALAEFDRAASSFQDIQRQLSELSTSLRTIVAVMPGDVLLAADQLAQAGIHLATAGRSLAAIVQTLSSVSLESLVEEVADTNITPNATSASLTDALVAVQPDVNQLRAELTEAGRLVVGMDTRGLPSDIAQPLEQAKGSIPGLLHQLNAVGGAVTLLAELGGATKARTYAVMFQNPNELRPTGGFWGQIAFVKLQNGSVEKLDIKSIYDPAGQLISRQAAPEGLDVISEEFSVQDANWYADFPTSARALMTMLSETGDPRLDGVIALTPNVVTDLLSLTGPIEIDELGLSVSEDTFVEEAQYEVAEKDPERDQTFFPGFTQGFLGRLFALDRDQGIAMIQALIKAVDRKDIQLFFGDETLAGLPELLGAGGELPVAGDLVAPIYSNIGGGKTDQYIQESRALEISLQGGVAHHELTITRRDTRDDQFKDRDNRSYMRLYVPDGAVLTSASGFDTDIKALIAHECDGCEAALGTPVEQQVGWEPVSNTKTYQESGHRVFANWVTLGPGEERTVRVAYDVPLSKLTQDQILRIQLWRQAGSGDIPVDSIVSGEGIGHVTGTSEQNGAWPQRLVLDRDHVVGVLLQ